MSFEGGLKTIVLATDLDGQSEGALEYARKLATAYGARMVLAHGVDPLNYAAIDAVPGKVLRGMPEEARTALDHLSAELIREGIHSHSEIRQGAVAQMLVDVARQYQAGLIVIVSFISPYRAERMLARDRVGSDEFMEIFVDTPVDECRRRDPKGLYQKADTGQIRNFTGVDAPYEEPLDPDIRLRTLESAPEQLADQVVEALRARGMIG